MLAGVQGDGDPDIPAQLVGPHSGRGYHVLSVNQSPVGIHADRPAVRGAYPLHRDSLDDASSTFLGHVGQGHGRVNRRGLPITGDPNAAHNAVRVEERPASDHLVGVDDIDVNVEAAGHTGAPDQFFHALRVIGHAHRPDPTEPCGVAHLVFESVVEVGAVGGQASHVVGGSEATDQPGSVPGGAAGQGVAFHQKHVGPSEFSQVVGDAGADDASTDDYHLGSVGNLGCHACLRRGRGGPLTLVVGRDLVYLPRSAGRGSGALGLRCECRNRSMGRL